jgi:energy-coupling factor transport system ATP-binding protein
MAADLALRLRGVRFRPDGSKTMVLDGVDLDVRPGEWILVMGPSGSGKTTFALTLNGTVPHSITGQFEGEVLVDGLLTTETPVATMATHIGMVFQDPDGQIVHETVRDEIYFGLENLQRGREEIIERAHRALDKVGMLHLLDAEIMSLSGGQKQRVSLASVLSLSPDIIVLDEPTANLDPQGMRDVFEVVEQVHKNDGVTVVMIEHHVDELVEKVDRVVVLEEGRVALDGPPAKVFTDVAPVASRRGLWLPQVCELAQAAGVTTASGRLPMNVEECVVARERQADHFAGAGESRAPRCPSSVDGPGSPFRLPGCAAHAEGRFAQFVQRRDHGHSRPQRIRQDDPGQMLHAHQSASTGKHLPRTGRHHEDVAVGPHPSSRLRIPEPGPSVRHRPNF